MAFFFFVAAAVLFFLAGVGSTAIPNAVTWGLLAVAIGLAATTPPSWVTRRASP